MGYYGVIFPEFWTGSTGRELRAHGKDAQLIGLYLATNRHANMLGLYRLLVEDVRHETGLGFKALERGFQATAAATYATFDAASSYVWVRNMARFRLGLKAGEALDPEDKKVLAINRIYHAIDGNPFLGEFFDVNHRILRIRKRREPSGLVVPFGVDHQMSGLEGAYQAPSKPGTGSGIRDQVQGSGKSAAASAAANSRTPADRNRNVIRSLVDTVVRQAAPETGFADLKELAKQACVDHHLAYDAEVVGSALEQALARKAKAS